MQWPTAVGKFWLRVDASKGNRECFRSERGVMRREIKLFENEIFWVNSRIYSASIFFLKKSRF